MIRFTGWGMCNFQFKVSGFQGISLNQSLDITDVFNFAGANQVRQYNVQLVDSSGNPIGNIFSTVASLTVNEAAVATTTTTTTVVNPQPAYCTLERVIDSSHPPTSNTQQSIWVRFQMNGPNVTGTLNGYSVGSGIYEIRTSTFPYFEMEGRVSNSFGSSTCRLSVATSYCSQSVVGQPSTTSVTTQLTVQGTYDDIYIQGVRQINPWWLFPTVSFTELFERATVERTRETSGLVRSTPGDSWSCPVSYTVPAEPPPAPPIRSYLYPGQELYSGDVLTAPGTNICNCRAVMQGDGNFVVYRGSTALWSTQTWRYPGSRLAFQTDGNLVVYQNSTARWSSNTVRKGGWILAMQADCNLVMYSYGYQAPVWSTKTNRAGCY